jgi:hypothetical protein
VVEWRRRKRGTPNQIGKPFPIEPHGDKRNLPKALRNVSLSEITNEIQGRRRKNMTEEELEEERMIDEIVEEEQQEKNALQKVKDGFAKLDKTLKKEQKRAEYRKALEEVKAEHVEDETAAIEEGYGEAWQERLEKKRKEKKQDFNPLMGDVG